MHRLTRRTQQILDARAVRVLVVGDVMLDVYLRGVASRISPEAPVPVVRVEDEWRALGGAANVAANVAALGAGCELIGCIGDDRAGADLLAELARQGHRRGGLVRAAGGRPR
jgi:bifunctional ADP-heptose synthase (sugar kinase/adenylyltransferase)